MDLLAVRSFVAQGTDEFSSWFYRHPPLFCLLMILCRPFQAGYAERVEIMAIMIGVINLLLLFALNRKLFGERAALWSCFFLAVMPGAMFFDVWIKRDHGVTTFALLALLALHGRRTWLAALAIGIAFLFKITAAFYYIAIIVYCLMEFRRRGGKAQLAVMLSVPALVCGWWYAVIDTSKVHVSYATMAEDFWSQPWFVYFRDLMLELGWPIQAILVLSVIPALAALRRRRLPVWARRAWPVHMLIPVYAGLSLLPNKTPWIVITLFPAWATLAGLSVDGLWRMVNRSENRAAHRRKIFAAARVSIAILIIGVCAAQAARIHYDEYFQTLLPDHHGASILAKDIVDYCNDVMKDGDRVLLTNFHFWGGVERRQPCAVFTYYLRPKVLVLMRPHDIPGDVLYDDVMEFKIDWAVVSPEPGESLQRMHREFYAKAGLLPKELQKAVVYDTRSLHEEEENSR